MEFSRQEYWNGLPFPSPGDFTDWGVEPRSSTLQPFLYLDFPGGSEVNACACNAGDLGSVPGLGRSPGQGNGNPLWYSCLENPIDRGVWQATVHRVVKRVGHDWACIHPPHTHSSLFIPFQCFNIHILQARRHFSEPTLKAHWVQFDHLHQLSGFLFWLIISKLGCEWNKVVRGYSNYLNDDY